MLTVEQQVLSIMAECVASPFCVKLHMQRRPFRERGFSHHTANFKTFRRFDYLFVVVVIVRV